MNSRVCVRLGLNWVCADMMWVYRHSAFTVAFMCLWCLYLWYISYILMRRMYWKSKDKGVCMHANMVLEGWMLVDVHLEHGQKSLCRGGA